MKLPTLDRSRDHSPIYGHFEENDPMHGSAWAQDGFLFTHQGDLVEKALTDKDRVRLNEIIDRDVALEAARAAFMQAKPDTKPEDLAKIITVELLNKPNEDEEIDLVAWIRGEKVYNFGKVSKAFRDQFNQSPVNKAQAREILAEHGLIPPVGGEPTIPSRT